MILNKKRKLKTKRSGKATRHPEGTVLLSSDKTEYIVRADGSYQRVGKAEEKADRKARKRRNRERRRVRLDARGIIRGKKG